MAKGAAHTLPSAAMVAKRAHGLLPAAGGAPASVPLSGRRSDTLPDLWCGCSMQGCPPFLMKWRSWHLVCSNKVMRPMLAGRHHPGRSGSQCADC
jgi:hypothetical protein